MSIEDFLIGTLGDTALAYRHPVPQKDRCCPKALLSPFSSRSAPGDLEYYFKMGLVHQEVSTMVSV